MEMTKDEKIYLKGFIRALKLRDIIGNSKTIQELIDQGPERIKDWFHFDTEEIFKEERKI